ncbi:hypothetical protein LEMA_P099600.1 [Plenodomus lingam JN3]|uniref:Uncharacterized protein n=1 Tax=Leptosphaeria maculans (strain JN3 / isolate v23.1.3 / race Av1-4-5-6-7-8) TaxID=985895 RepID=E4ZZW9_LEPMJ|nr:hypothetical protein LEMA_P099600.1 [Plenodomus lingam JN3]CBX96829.1 hypothetical protein LEMA_P099600.1 [Plenodomus lingam JN3]
MAPQIPPLDEQEFDQPALIAGLPGQNLNVGNNLFWYFTSSPWFEPQSINISVFQNVQLSPDGQQIMNDRALWEERLRAVEAGTQFIVTAEPQGEGQPWVLQRQNKRHNHETGRPAGCDAESHAHHLDAHAANGRSGKQHDTLDPSHRLLLLTALPPKLPSQTAAPTSRIGSPSLAPTDPDAALSQTAPTSVPPAADPVASTVEFSDALFMQSLHLTDKYGDEFMDENPLKGEPGAFVFENTKTAVDARNKAQEQAAQASHTAAPAATTAATTATARPDTRPPSIAPPSTAPTPAVIGTPAATEAHSRKGSVAPAPARKKDKSRRKSQTGLASPTTPKAL